MKQSIILSYGDGQTGLDIVDFIGCTAKISMAQGLLILMLMLIIYAMHLFQLTDYCKDFRRDFVNYLQM